MLLHGGHGTECLGAGRRGGLWGLKLLVGLKVDDMFAVACDHIFLCKQMILI